ncbi:hypothetical protein SDRG_11230 [Saprolegnia diclina VS20]|uniref:Uncharacterized protein n=1 Tax=Saprolegnia diclina (strain VS20) TaxID=1156394 RepID=T0RFH8_SAPDV|nr:hypothetical protein SDRG_11230 [Saprolegnia diclina VS20]EQC31043.1 hypothetical protein SDRG_11230 [Saprolegnia diclina VS20]|eukprot:XP_008615482.1 hypothetical protein SDRG_11230 [Saprolegnia diclina VS20]
MATSYEENVWFAAKMGRLDELTRLIEVDGHAFDAQDDQLKSPFYYGCTFNQPEVLAYLTTLYARRNVVMPEEQRAWCILSCLNEDVRLFLEGKTTIEAVIADRAKKAHNETLSPVAAAAQGNMARLRYFIKSEPLVLWTADAVSGKTPVEVACDAGHAPATATLLSAAKKELSAAAYDDLVARCVASTTPGSFMHRVVRGEVPMKEIMAAHKQATPSP